MKKLKLILISALIMAVNAQAESTAKGEYFVVSDDINAPYWNPRGKSTEEIAKRAAILTTFYDNTRTPEERAADAPVRKKYHDAIVINSVIPTSVGIVGNRVEHFQKGLQRNIDAGMTLASATLYGFPTDKGGEFSTRVKNSNAVLNSMGIKKVETTHDIRQAKADKRMVVMYNTQGADFVIDDLAQVAKVNKLGVKAMNFVYNNNNALATGGSSNYEVGNSGVTKLGKQFIAKANAVGVIVDCSHSSNQTCIDAAKYSTKPMIASHSNAMGVHNVSRNMSDAAIRAVGSTGGVVCSTGVGLFLNPEGDASPEAFAEHVQYTSKLIGRDKTCFSSDYTHNMEEYLNAFIPRVDIYPPERGFAGYMTNTAVEDVWGVVKVLEDKYSWSEQDIRGFLGENLMRVYQANWH